MKWYFRLWLLAQLTVLGTYDKQRLVLKHYRGQRRILEIGCSVGNVSMAFRQFPNINFVGLDIDLRRHLSRPVDFPQRPAISIYWGHGSQSNRSTRAIRFGLAGGRSSSCQ